MAECKTLRQWVDEKDVPETECRPCHLAAAVGEYQTVLTESGHADLAAGLSKALEGSDPLGDVASSMDAAKGAVEPEVRELLQSLDCEIQVSAASKAVEEVEGGDHGVQSDG